VGALWIDDDLSSVGCCPEVGAVAEVLDFPAWGMGFHAVVSSGQRGEVVFPGLPRNPDRVGDRVVETRRLTVLL
jgi:hypothetical protein